MERSVFATATSIVAVVSVSVTLGAGCGSEGKSGPSSSSLSSSDPTTDASLAMLCGEGEIYIPAAMNAKLKIYPAFANTAGLSKVTDCASGLRYMQAYAGYSLSHPGFDAHQPPGELPARPVHLPNTPAPELKRLKVANGTAVHFAPEVVLQNFGTLTGCSGSFIAKDFVLTAAHCLTPNSARPSFSQYYFLDGGPDAAIPDGTAKFAKIVAYVSWQIGWADANGNVILPGQSNGGDSSVVAMLDTFAYQYPDTRWSGVSRDLQGLNDIWDVALLYLPPVLNDPVLPASPSDGSALPIAIVPPTPSDNAFFFGWGPNFNQLAIGVSSQHYDLSTPGGVPQSGPASDTYLSLTVANGDGRTCAGDSGGAAGRLINLTSTQTPAPPLIEVAGVLHGAGSLDSTKCAPVGATEQWTRVDAETDFINQTIGLWEPNFACRPQINVDTGGFEYAECWGEPCDVDTDCPSGSYCSQSPQTTLGSNACAACSTGDCSCIKGQCLPLQTFPLNNRACVTDDDCGGEAPVCVVPDDGGVIGTCQAFSDAGDGGP